MGHNTTTVTLSDIVIKAFSVAAMNEAGIGEHSPPLQVTTTQMGEEILRHSRRLTVKFFELQILYTFAGELVRASVHDQVISSGI